MATRHALRLVQHRFCSSGKVLGQEKKAVESVFIKKMEQEKLGKLARKQGEENSAAAGGLGPIIADAKKPSSSSSTSGGLYNYMVRVVKFELAKFAMFSGPGPLRLHGRRTVR
ncbi:hypothetical protein OROMI_015997 [Orobanche minor]